MFASETWRGTGCGLIFDLCVCVQLVTWRWIVCGLILHLGVCVGDLEIGSTWIDS